MSLDGIRGCFTSMEKGFEKAVTVFCTATNESKPTEFAFKLSCVLRILPPLAQQTFSGYANFLEAVSISADVKSLLDNPSIAGGLFVFADACSLIQQASSIGLISLSHIASKAQHFTVRGHTLFKGAKASMLSTACSTSLVVANCLAVGTLFPKLKAHYNEIQVKVGLEDQTYTETFKAKWNSQLEMRNVLYDFVFHTSSALFFSANVFYPTALTSEMLSMLSALSMGAGLLKNYNPKPPSSARPPLGRPATPTPPPPPATPRPPQAPVTKPALPLRLAYGAVDVATVVQKTIGGIDGFRHLLRSATLIAKENNLIDGALANDIIKVCDEVRDFNSKVLFAPWAVLAALKTPKNYQEFQDFVRDNKCVNEFFGLLRVVSNLTGGINKFIGFFDYFARLGCRVPFITRLASGVGSSTVFGYGVGKSLSYITPSLRIVTTLSEGWRDYKNKEEFGLVKCFYTCSIEMIKLFYVHTGGKKFPKGSASGGMLPYAALALSIIHISNPIFKHYVMDKKEIKYPKWMQRREP